MAREALNVGSQRLRIALAVPPLLAIFLLGQAILDARGLRLDLTPERRYTLSDQATRILDGLPADVRITAFLRSQDPRNQVIDTLLRQVQRRTSRVSVERLEVKQALFKDIEGKIKSWSRSCATVNAIVLPLIGVALNPQVPQPASM